VLVLDNEVPEDEVASARSAAYCEKAGGEVISDAAADRVLVCFAKELKALRAADSHSWLITPPLPPVSPMISSPEEDKHDVERPGAGVTIEITVVEENVNVDACIDIDVGIAGSREEAPVMF
jgi:hypothetical protein